MNQPVSNSEPPEDATRRSYKACHCATQGEAAKVKVSKVKQERKRKSCKSESVKSKTRKKTEKRKWKTIRKV